MVFIPTDSKCPKPLCAGEGGANGTPTINQTVRRHYFICPICGTTWSQDFRIVPESPTVTKVVLESQNVIKIRSKGKP